jgi:hypothetical protein
MFTEENSCPRHSLSEKPQHIQFSDPAKHSARTDSRECLSSGSKTALSNATTLSTAATFFQRAETKSLLYKTSFGSEEHNPHFCEQEMNYALVSVATSGVSSKLSVSVFLYETCICPPKAFRRFQRAFTGFVRELCLTSNNSNV